MLALWLDLAHRLWAWRFYAVFRPTSPMSWGAWILCLVYPVGLASRPGLSERARSGESFEGGRRESSGALSKDLLRIRGREAPGDSRHGVLVGTWRSASTRASFSGRCRRASRGTARSSARSSSPRASRRARRPCSSSARRERAKDARPLGRDRDRRRARPDRPPPPRVGDVRRGGPVRGRGASSAGRTRRSSGRSSSSWASSSRSRWSSSSRGATCRSSRSSPSSSSRAASRSAGSSSRPARPPPSGFSPEEVNEMQPPPNAPSGIRTSPGVVLGLVLLGSFLVMGFGLGSSGAVTRFAVAGAHLVAPKASRRTRTSRSTTARARTSSRTGSSSRSSASSWAAPSARTRPGA